MDVAKPGVREHAGLGVLEQCAEARAEEAAPAIEYLGTLGLVDPGPGVRNTIALAMVHSSYCHESRIDSPGMTKGVLEALNALGVAFIHREAAARIYRTTATTASRSMSTGVARVVSTFPQWTSSQEWIRQSAALSVGLDRENLSPKITAFLCRQVIGALCLMGEEAVAARLLSDHIGTELRRQLDSVHDSKSVLEESLGRDTVTYEYEREGPDHAAVFHAVVTDTRHRHGEGTGRSKKAAAREAALDFLRRHIPGALAARPQTGVRRPTPLELPAREPHAQTVRRIQGLFRLPDTARPLLSQALVHGSWAFENRAEMARCRQQDYQVLAHLGAQALIYEHLRVAAQHMVKEPTGKFSFLTLSNDIYDSALRQTGLSVGLLLGTGQKTNGIPTEVGADAFQAVIGAVTVAAGFPATLAEKWPSRWEPIWQLVAPATPRPADPTTLLERTARAMKLQVRHEFRVEGPHHASLHTATGILGSAPLGLDTKVEGSTAVGKAAAKHNVSLVVLNSLDRLAERFPARAFDGADGRDRSLALFLLAHQAYVLATETVPIQRWIDAKLFGLHLADNAADLLEWAVGADELLGFTLRLQPDSLLPAAFRNAIANAADPDHTLDTALAHAMDTLEQFEAPEDMDQAYLQHLVQLCDVYRCLGADDPDTDLSDLAADWQILHRGRVTVPISLPHARLTGRERAVLDAAVSTVTTNREPISVEMVADRPLHLRFRSTESPAPDHVEKICALWSKVTRTAIMEATDHGIDVIISRANTPAEPGPVTQAVVDALRPGPEPYRAAVADLLHDLKNQLVAARLASAEPAETRTGRLQQQLTASRHLDSAHSLALRLRAATSLLGSHGSESVELGGFLRHYAGTVLARLPAKISLAIPEARRAVRVAVDARALTAVLDNLVGNAIEALHDGGAITLAWTADDYEAAVEIADNGPGLPSDIADAFASGQRVRSTKAGGNGLGLLGVRSLLARVGGQLTPVATHSGTAWLITLPLAAPTTSESS
ncbi:ATP-binding protein (plasmid) [Streptomyces sp. NBC_00841]|uniref:ATP-binding protein n=1 Tax=Streptomyces sp. NBC_00841 TaxID=2975847 RepID=UPI002DDA1EF5|nr:ATP-binding protein [Streptomyces sp. NBC_00841]WSA05018.1 ATP-binding protein [Streptomyces sp. NBC_00841]